MSIEALTVVLHHSRAKNSAKVVLMGIANHYHPDDDRGAWPSQDLLARYANVTDRQVRKCIGQLVALGELRVESHGGPSKGNYKPNKYWITLDCPEDCDGSMNHRKRATGTIEQDNRNYLTEQPEPEFRRTLTEPEENSLTSSFNEFWDVYPRKLGKGEAQKAFEKAVKRHGLDVIMGGVRCLASDPNLPDPQFIPRAATWLNGERWGDDPYPPKQPSGADRFLKPPAEIPDARAWVKQMHDLGEHWECKPGEFGCK